MVWGHHLVQLAHAKAPTRFGLAALAVLGAALISALSHPVTLNISEWRLITMIGYVAVGYVAVAALGEEAIVQGSMLAGWALLPVIIVAANTGLLWENRNIIATFPVILAPIGLIGAVPGGDLVRTGEGESPNKRLLWLALAITAEISLGSAGGMLAMVVCLVVTFQRSLWRLLFPGLGLAVVFAIARPESTAWRLEYWRVAWDAFLSSPIVGVGPGSYASLWPVGQAWYHAHNIVITTAAETGLIGIAALEFAWLKLLNLTRRHPGAWQTAVIAGLLAHSLVDEPLQFWGPGLAFVAAAATLDVQATRESA
jgi:hypothetical protein